MRTLVQPLPASRCVLCGGELRLKLIEPADRESELDYQIYVCVSCGHEQSYAVAHDHYVPHTKVA
jgi:hypothetical protein